MRAIGAKLGAHLRRTGCAPYEGRVARNGPSRHAFHNIDMCIAPRFGRERAERGVVCMQHHSRGFFQHIKNPARAPIALATLAAIVFAGMALGYRSFNPPVKNESEEVMLIL